MFLGRVFHRRAGEELRIQPGMEVNGVAEGEVAEVIRREQLVVDQGPRKW